MKFLTPNEHAALGREATLAADADVRCRRDRADLAAQPTDTELSRLAAADAVLEAADRVVREAHIVLRHAGRHAQEAAEAGGARDGLLSATFKPTPDVRDARRLFEAAEAECTAARTAAAEALHDKNRIAVEVDRARQARRRAIHREEDAEYHRTRYETKQAEQRALMEETTRHRRLYKAFVGRVGEKR